MNILFVTPFKIFPPYWGGGIRTYNLLKSLAKNHKIFLLFPSFDQFKNTDGSSHKNELKKIGIEIFDVKPLVRINHPIVKHINPELIIKGIELILTKNIDVIICDYPWSGIDVLFLHLITGKPYVLIEHNIEYQIKDEIRAKYSLLMKMLEKILWKSSKIITTVSERDKYQIVKSGINKEKIFVVENGFDENRFKPNHKVREKIRNELGVGDKPLIFFYGKLNYPPNKEAVYKIYDEIMPRVVKRNPDAKFLIAGEKDEFNFEIESMIFCGLIENVEDYINASDVVIAPLLSGGGTRIKILESIACGKTVISTSKGADGLVNDLTRPFLKISDNWIDFSNLILELLNDKNHAPAENFVKKYSWKNIYENFNVIINNLKPDKQNE